MGKLSSGNGMKRLFLSFGVTLSPLTSGEETGFMLFKLKRKVK
jgi:hypothetical protein